jgi:hypothetical protein
MELPETITCTKCGEIKPLTSEYFIPNSGYKFGFTRWCKVCSSKHNEIYREENSEDLRVAKQVRYQENREAVIASTKKYREENPEKIRQTKRNQWLFHNFKRTPEWYEETLASQGGHCALCDSIPASDRRFQVDHDHNCCPTDKTHRKTCGKCVRGLLCEACNTELGSLERLMTEFPLERRDQAEIYLRNSVIKDSWTYRALKYLKKHAQETQNVRKLYQRLW